jgi:hypothetical protein
MSYKVLTNVVVQPIFWGPVWDDAAHHDLANEIVLALRQLVASPYMRALAQYENIAPGTFCNAIFDKAAPPVAMTSTSPTPAAHLRQLIADGTVPDFHANDQLLYMFFTQGVELTYETGVLIQGFHYFAPFVEGAAGDLFHYACVNSPYLIDATYGASHELVEACTDPDLDGLIVPGGPSGTEIEIGDRCEVGGQLCEGVFATPYWSVIDNECVLPSRRFRIDIEQDECRVGPTMGEKSTLRAIGPAMQPDWIDSTGLSPLIGPAVYEWSWDPALVIVTGTSDQLTLNVEWFLPNDFYTTTITFTATYGKGIVLEESIVVTPRSPLQARVALLACRLRKFLADDNRRPPFFIHKLGPDPAPLPSQNTLQEVKSFVKQLEFHVEHLERAIQMANAEKRGTSSQPAEQRTNLSHIKFGTPPRSVADARNIK